MVPNLQFSPPRKVTIVDSIIDQVVAQIKDGTLKAGDKLPSEREMISMLRVGRSSVREALQALAAMDLLEVRPGEGTFVKEPKAPFGRDMDIESLSGELQKEMRHRLNEARLILELGIVSLAAENVTEATGAAIRQALEDYEVSRESPSRQIGVWSAHDRFHLAMAEATGNTFLVRILQSLLRHVPVALRSKGGVNLPPEQQAARRLAEFDNHRELCAALIRGDGPAACEWMRRHAVHEKEVIDTYYGP